MFLAVDVAKVIGEVVCSWPADADEDVEDVHECGVAVGALAQQRSVPCKVLLDHVHHERFCELFILIAVLAPCAHNVTCEDEHACRVNGDEVHECFEDLMRGVWVSDVRELREYGLGVLVEDVGWQKRSVLA